MLGAILENLFWIGVGYILCIIVPAPWLSPFVLRLWQKLIAKIRSL